MIMTQTIRLICWSQQFRLISFSVRSTHTCLKIKEKTYNNPSDTMTLGHYIPELWKHFGRFCCSISSRCWIFLWTCRVSIHIYFTIHQVQDLRGGSRTCERGFGNGMYARDFGVPCLLLVNHASHVCILPKLALINCSNNTLAPIEALIRRFCVCQTSYLPQYQAKKGLQHEGGICGVPL